MKRRRFQSAVKWSTTIAALLVLGLVALSARWSIFYEGRSATIAVRTGTLYFWPGAHEEAAGWSFDNAWQYDNWWLDHLRVNIRRNHAWIPLWLPALLLLIPAVLLWHRDLRRVAPGHCRQCGYDLTGNVSGRCPECGARLPPKAQPSSAGPP